MSPKKRRIDYWQHPDAPKPTNRKASASVVVRDESGRVLLRRPDNDLWTIPTGAVKRGETVAEAAVRECRKETGLQVRRATRVLISPKIKVVGAGWRPGWRVRAPEAVKQPGGWLPLWHLQCRPCPASCSDCRT